MRGRAWAKEIYEVRAVSAPLFCRDIQALRVRREAKDVV